MIRLFFFWHVKRITLTEENRIEISEFFSSCSREILRIIIDRYWYQLKWKVMWLQRDITSSHSSSENDFGDNFFFQYFRRVKNIKSCVTSSRDILSSSNWYTYVNISIKSYELYEMKKKSFFPKSESQPVNFERYQHSLTTRPIQSTKQVLVF